MLTFNPLKLSDYEERRHCKCVRRKKHQQLFNWLANQPDESWDKGPEGKWTTGQHIEHLVDSIKKVNHALSFPKFILKHKFGTSNRDTRSYNEVAKRYQEKLSANQDKSESI